jgi:hypothetical protein
VGVFPETEEMPGAWFGLAENERLRPAGASRTNFCQVGHPEVTLGLALRTASHIGPDKSGGLNGSMQRSFKVFF